jgi:hypothetical protein
VFDRVSRDSVRRLILGALLVAGLLVACTAAPTPPPSAKDSGANPAGLPSPSPAAQVSATPIPPRPAVSGGAAQPRVNPTFQAPGGNAIVVVPTPNFSTNPTAVPAALAPGVSLTTPQAANIPQVTGTLSRIPTAITTGGGGGGGAGGGAGTGTTAAAAAGAAAAVTGGGGGTGIQTIPPPITSTPLIRINPQPQPTIAFPGR